MPRYRFSWEKLPAGLLRALKQSLELQGDAATALRAAYGARPGSDFVREAWPVLLHSWLPRDRVARTRIVESLRGRHLGDVSLETRTIAGQLAYLRSCRNGETLREIVADTLVAAGEPDRTATPDVATSRSKAWPPFVHSLATTLAALEEEQYLILERKDRPWYVQFAAQGTFGMRAELVSNAYLQPNEQLSEAACATALRLGWLAPTGTPESATPDKDPDGSSNYFRDWSPPVPFEKIAALAVDTLVDVLHVAHPGALHYKAFARDGSRILFPALGPRRQLEQRTAPEHVPEPLNAEQIRVRVLDTLRRASSNADLAPDKDGDIPLRFGSSMVFVRVFGDPPIVRVYSPVLSAVDGNDIVEELNELNEKSFFTKWLLADRTVFAVVELFGNPLVDEYVLQTIGVLGQTVDGNDEQLQQRFGGKTFFGDYVRPKLAPNTGGYL